MGIATQAIEADVNAMFLYDVEYNDFFEYLKASVLGDSGWSITFILAHLVLQDDQASVDCLWDRQYLVGRGIKEGVAHTMSTESRLWLMERRKTHT